MKVRTLYDKYYRELKLNVTFGIIASVLLFLLAAVVVVNNLVFVKVYVSGPSMRPTLQNGDLVMLNVYRAPEYGDIIVISDRKSVV